MSTSIPSNKPYLIRALHEWCRDNGFTPYIHVLVDNRVCVPQQYVKDDSIILNISMSATQKLSIGNDLLSFTTRFHGQIFDISIPIDNVAGIYAKETNQGMQFAVTPEAKGAIEKPTPRQQKDHTSHSKARLKKETTLNIKRVK
jgi:stringent starvation protein B